MNDTTRTITLTLTDSQLARLRGALEYQRLTTDTQQDADKIELIQQIITNSLMLSHAESL